MIENLSVLKKQKNKVRIRDMRNFNESNFTNELKNLKLDEVLKTIPDLNIKYEYFHDKILYLINKHAPMRDATKKENKRIHNPWITSAILKSIKLVFQNTNSKILIPKYYLVEHQNTLVYLLIIKSQ